MVWHSHWGLTEIVRAIAANLVSDKAKASAVALATCCKSLEEPALGELWRHLSDLAPLVRCFPPDVWEVREELLYIKRAPLCAEWTRFQQQYAPKVRYLVVPAQCKISPAALHLLQHLSDCTPLLPNLVSLKWELNDFIPFVPLFISRSLTSLDIHVPAEATAMLSPILRKVSTISPYIMEIHVRSKDMYFDPSTIEASSQLLMQCNHRLQKYKFGAPISISVLRHVIQLPSLRVFWLIFDSSICQLPHPLPAVVFPSLRALHVEHSGQDHTWLNLLPAIESPVFSRISVGCPGWDVAHFMEAFQLTMTGCDMHERLELFQLQSPDQFKITPHIIACSFPFKNLTTLHVMSRCSSTCQTSNLADSDIDLLTQSLPCLGSLILGGKPCSVPSKITFKSLYTISHRCTRLKTLQIHFNPAALTTIEDTEGWDVALGLPSSPSSELCAVTTIHAGKIRWYAATGTSLVVLVLGLVGVFPHLENVECDEYNKDWEGIDDMIKVVRRMGRFAFG